MSKKPKDMHYIVTYTVPPERGSAFLAELAIPGYRFVSLNRKGTKVRVTYEKRQS